MTGAAKLPGTAVAPAVDPTKAATDAVKDKAGTMLPKTGAAVPGAAAVPAVDPTKAATETAEDLAKKKAAEAAKGVVK